MTSFQSQPQSSPDTGRRRSNLYPWLLALTLLVLGFALRLYDLTDQPIDFHPTRQLRGALVARGLYYQMLPGADPETRQQAIAFGASTGQYEPSIVESVVARIYLLMGAENLWISRIVTSFFWIIGGLALFALARRLTSSSGALLALGYYLVLPFAVQASRSFQPDPGMVMWIMLGVYALYRWGERPSWKWAVLAGILTGVAVLTKVVAGYIVGAAAIAVVLYTLGVRRFWRSPQVYLMAALMVTPTLIYYSTRQSRASDYLESWTISLSHLLLEPSFYVRWLSMVQNLMGLSALLIGVVGILIAAPRARLLLLSLWAGYAVYGLTLPYQMYTHSYYHLQLVPIVALSLAPVGQLIWSRVSQQGGGWRLIFTGVLLVGMLYPAWTFIAEQNREDNRGEPAYWQEIASFLPTDGKIIALTQDYGFRLEYYGWRKVSLWPTRGERTLSSLRGSVKEFENYFGKRTEGKNYFLITAFGQLRDQPDLQQMLTDHYTLIAQGDGYLIYDLEQPR
jgi:hypothetical protein